MEQLSTRLFRSLGFYRRRCPYCGKHFWTLNPGQENCGDQPCTPYGFIGNSPVRRGIGSIAEARERFLSFFERNGHARVRRYPVVARWRDDVFLVGASIYDFQPWVTNGTIPPPANPLTISQPSIRLTDVDKVGKSGRHLTGFEMMAHHAFNYPDKYVYWVDETVEYAYRFFAEELGIDPMELTFKENIWEGGGNAGESFEVLVRGLEIATLVFMHYEVRDGKYLELPLKIVDTGYGLERIYWLASGAPTVYEAVFSGFLGDVRRLAGIPQPDPHLLGKAATFFGQLDPELTSFEKAYAIVAEKVGVDVEAFKREVRPHEILYMLADHTRTVSWMLADGVVPSNTGVGYLARLLLRRALRGLYGLGIEVPLRELFDVHLKHLRHDFPEVWDARDLILELVEMEERKFREIVRSAPSIVERAVKERARKAGTRSIDAETLVELYDSHGIPPEIVGEVCRGMGIDVSIPDDFYTILAARHQKPKEAQSREKIGIDLSRVKDLPKTVELFYEDQYLRSFAARVVDVIDGKYVVLDATAFYPEGGGQPADTGRLEWDGGSTNVVDVQRVGHVIVHRVEGGHPPIGATVRGTIDWERRLSLMRMHTGTHLVLQSTRRVLGRHIWQAGAQKDIPATRLDVTHFKHIEKGEVRKLERVANDAVMRNLPVKAVFMPRNVAESLYGFTIYQGGVVPARDIRIVSIGYSDDAFDVQACGGTHTFTTGEIGLVKIVKAEKIADGVVRLHYTTGAHLMDYVNGLEDALDEISSLLGTSRDSVQNAVKRLIGENKEYVKRISRLTSRLSEYLVGDLLRRAEQLGKALFTYYIASEDDDEELVRAIAHRVTRQRNAVLLVVAPRGGGLTATVYTGGEVHAGEVMRSLTSLLGGRGGGSETYAQGTFRASIDELINAVRAVLR